MDVPQRFEVLDPEALARRLGYTRATVLTHLSRGRFDKIPPPSRRLAMGPLWYAGDVEKWRERSLTPTDPNAAPKGTQERTRQANQAESGKDRNPHSYEDSQDGRKWSRGGSNP